MSAQPRRIRRFGALALATVLAIVLPTTVAGSSGPDIDAPAAVDEGDWAAYARLFGISIEAAYRDAAIVDQARELQANLESSFPTEFAGLWVDRNAGIHVIVALTADRGREIRGLAPSRLVPYIETRVVDYSLAALQERMKSLDLPDGSYATTIDVTTNSIVVEAYASDINRASDAMSRSQPSPVRFVEATKLPVPLSIYGGLTHHSTCGGIEGTIGFSVSKGSTNGVVTAGHLANCGTVNGNTLTFKGESNSGNADAEWFTSTTTELPKFQYNSSGATRFVYSKTSRSNVVIGQTVCKYGRTTGYTCGSVKTKNFDPDGVFGPFSGVWLEIQDCGGPLIADDGDSGGPAFYGTAAIGIVTHGGGDIFCGNKMYVNSWSEFETSLGIFVNYQP